MNAIIRRRSSCADLEKSRKLMAHLHFKQKSLDETTSFERYRRLSSEATVINNPPSSVLSETRKDQGTSSQGEKNQGTDRTTSCSEEDGSLDRTSSILRRRLSEESILEARRERIAERKLKTMSAIDYYVAPQEREDEQKPMGKIEKIVERNETVTLDPESDAQRSKSLTQIDCLEQSKMGHTESVSRPCSKSDPSPEDTSPSSTLTQSTRAGHLVVPTFFEDSLPEPAKETCIGEATPTVSVNEAKGVDNNSGPISSAHCLTTSCSLASSKNVAKSHFGNSSTPKEDKHGKRRSQRNRRGALMVSEEDCSEESSYSFSQDSSAIKQLRARSSHSRKSGGIFSNPFKTDKEKMEQLTEFLNYYSANGIPERSIFPTPKEKLDELYYLEDQWQAIVLNADELPKRMQNQQDAIWELLQTEISYIKMLRVISDLFLSCLCNLQGECLLNDIDTDKMFSNITEVYGANHQFWVDYLLPMLNESRSTHLPLNPSLMAEGFLKVEEILHPYIKYCLEHSNCLHYVKEKHKESELFKAYVVWCETRKDCDRLRLLDLLVKPMQRLTKYSLLLKAILKKTEVEDQKVALKQMNHSMERFVYRVDATLRRRHEQDKLASIASRIESYDVLESSNDEVEKVIREYSNLDLTCPMLGCQSQQIRHLLLEGSGLKLRDPNVSGKIDVHCFLFSDLLLICKPAGKKSGDRVRVVRPPYLVDRTVIHELKDGSGFIVIYLNEFKVATSAFTLHTPDSKTWIDYIRKAQKKYKEAKQSALLSAQASERTFDEEDEVEMPSHAFLHTAHSSLRSSRSSLVQSHSGSTEISDTSAIGSMALIGPPTTPNYLSQPNVSQQHPSRAVSFELGELRNPSMTVDDIDAFGRSQSMETRVPISVTITSPRPERRAFLLRGAGATVTGASTSSTNTLSVSVPYHVSKHFHSSSDPPSIQVPIIHSNAKTLQRSFQTTGKPPLIKTKNVTTPSVTVQSAPPSGGPSPVHSVESEPGSESGGSDEQESLKSRLNQKRINRAERRYHTADSIENMKKDKDSSIHKRLSWNLGAHQGNNNRQLCNKHLIKCLSSDSVYSSSGFSSTESVTLSVGSDQYAMDLLGHIQEMEHVPEEKESNIKIDVSEVKDGISSVHITVNGGSGTKPSKTDLKKMKELLLTSLEASEV